MTAEHFVSTLARLTVRPWRRVPVVRLEMPIVYVGDTVVGHIVQASGDDAAWQYVPVDDTGRFVVSLNAPEYATPESAALALASCSTPAVQSWLERAEDISVFLVFGAVLGTLAGHMTGGWPL